MNSESTTQPSYKKLVEQAQKHEAKGAIKKAARFYRLAADNAATLWANEEGLDNINRALALTTDANPTGRFQLLLLRETLYGRLGQIEQQEVDLVALSTLAHFLNDDRLRARVAARLSEFKLARGEFRDVISTVNLALRLTEIAGADQEAAALHLLSGRALLRQDKYTEADTQLKQGLTLAESGGWTRETADGHRFLGVLALDINNPDQARTHYEQALPLYRRLADKRGEGDVLNNLGNLAHAQGKLGEALAYWDQAHDVYKVINDKTGSCRLLINQSAACMDMGLYDKARAYFQEALTISREINLAFGEALALINLALVEHYADQQQTAFDTAQDALRVSRQMGSSRLEGYALAALGKILTILGDLDAAAEAFWEALAIWQELEQPNLAFEAQAGLARVALVNKNTAQAVHDAQPIINYLVEGGDLEGTESPMGIMVTCIEVLRGMNDPLADNLLEHARAMIETQAAGIHDKEAKQSFLNQVAVNRSLMTLVNSSNEPDEVI